MHDTSGEPCYRAKSREFRENYDGIRWGDFCFTAEVGRLWAEKMDKGKIEWEGEDADKDE